MLFLFLREDFRFPILEIFAFLFVLLVLYTGSFSNASSPAQIVLQYFSGLTFFSSSLLFLILIWKNLAFGFGGDFEKGINQTYLTYPVSRRLFIVGRLLSAVAVPLALLVLSQALVLYLLAPGFLESNFSTFTLAFLGYLGEPLLITAIVLLIAVLSKTSGSPLIVGIILYFALLIVLQIAVGYATTFANTDLLIASFIFEPLLSFQTYSPNGFGGFGSGPLPPGSTILWSPSSANILMILLANYAVSAVIVAVSLVYFTRRLEP
jgi:ABC-type transport system involved in multi-copper enzyme maturation permease subunit